uniref:KIB1-4 beta-propeller domain-containing protein n=1 Tax=Leersia perrieri TaxID=77586 RepID=A0A0D9VYS1_9ORYZ
MSHVRSAPGRRAKRPRRLHDLRRKEVSILGNEMIPIWGAKRARNLTGSRKLKSILAQINTDWRDWTNLGEGPAGLIAERILSNDFAVRGDSAPRTRADRRFHPRQWVLFETDENHGRGFVNLCSGRLNLLPEIRDHDVFGPTTEGLLVLVDRTTYVVRLLNPFTRQASNLPPTTELLSPDGCRLELRYKSLKVSGAGLADDFTVAVLFGDIDTVAVAKPGDVHWTVVHRALGGTWLAAGLSFAGNFYCASATQVMVVKMSAECPPRMAIAAKLPRPISAMMLDSVHLVEIEGKLMLVDRQSNGSREMRKFKVYHIDLDAGKMVPVHGLFGHAVFIGVEQSLSVSPSVFPSISADTIYLGFDSLLTGTMDYSPIHLMDGTAEPRNDVNDINGMPIYQPQCVDEYLSWCVTPKHTYGSMSISPLGSRGWQHWLSKLVHTTITPSLTICIVNCCKFDRRISNCV